jgi:hypothetical protein
MIDIIFWYYYIIGNIELWYYYFIPRVYRCRKLVRDFKNEPGDNIVSINNYGWQCFYTLKNYKRRYWFTDYYIETLYAYEGGEDAASEEFMEKIRDVYTSKKSVHIGELKNIYLSGIIRD